jgi:hypothetical protein
MEGGPDQGSSRGGIWPYLPPLMLALAALIPAIGGFLVLAGFFKPEPTPIPSLAVVAGETPSPDPTPKPKPKITPSPSPSAPLKGADLVIGDLSIHAEKGYPSLDLLVANRGDARGELVRIVFRSETDAVCSGVGPPLPQPDYDVLLPSTANAMNEDFAVALPERYPVGPGKQRQIVIAVGMKNSFSAQCRFQPYVALRYFDEVSGERRDTPEWDEAIQMTVYPLIKRKIPNLGNELPITSQKPLVQP